MQIAANAVVSIHYTLTNTAGEQLDSSAGQEPLAYLHGANNIIPGLESALVGKGVGDKLSVTVDPEQGYGQVREELIQDVDRANFEGIDVVEPGMQFMAQTPGASSRSPSSRYRTMWLLWMATIRWPVRP